VSILDFISGIFKPAADLVDNVHTSTEEKLVQQNVLATIQNQVTAKLIELESQILTAKAKIITAEANGQSWMQRNWRPVTMLTFLFLVVMDSFGWLPNRLADEAWTLLQIGLGGYVVGRSAEQIAKKIKG
jgi:hypothetical protein